VERRAGLVDNAGMDAMGCRRWMAGLGGAAALLVVPLASGQLPDGVELVRGPVNGLRVGDATVVYGDPVAGARPADRVLFTHSRRDVVWAGAGLVRDGADAIVPAAERRSFEDPDGFWREFEEERFHDYAQRTTKVPREAVPVARAVRGGDVLELDGGRIEVIDTPGYSPGAVSYLIETGGKRIVCTGDLILKGGNIPDLYSLQDAVPEAKARGYHGYAARAGELIASLRKIAAAEPDVLVPARGAIIEDPQREIAVLIERLQAVLQSHFSTDALLWYWGEENLRVRSAKALDGEPVRSMPMAEERELPEWIVPIGNSRLIVSESGAGFLVDAGYRRIVGALEELRAAGRFERLEGIWVTHYHDDHTDHVQEVAEKYGAPVYFTESMTGILRHPSAYRMPCLTMNPVTGFDGQPDGETMEWQEFELTFFHFPGQTYYHGGLYLRRGEDEIFFVGDSFTPSGLDDYCLQNRNLIRPGEGYLYCLDRIEQHPRAWLINQHVAPMFQFDGARIDRMRDELRRRAELLEELSPWPEINYLLDESWARVYPYGQEVAAGQVVEAELRILNHSPKAELYRVRWNLPAGLREVEADSEVRIPAREEGRARVRIKAEQPGLHVFSADVGFGSHELREWTEGMVRVR
jgi:glyoxylase-like metal-dependent hydrolase (beta-lactamase superfamily II)